LDSLKLNINTTC